MLAMLVRCHWPTNMYYCHCRTSKTAKLFPLLSLSVAVQQSSSSTSSRFQHTVLAADPGSPVFSSCWNLSGGRSKQLLTNIPMQIPIKVHSWVHLTRSFCVFDPVSSHLILLAWCSQAFLGVLGVPACSTSFCLTLQMPGKHGIPTLGLTTWSTWCVLRYAQGCLWLRHPTWFSPNTSSWHILSANRRCTGRTSLNITNEGATNQASFAINP